jgi:hypothetical protein
VLADANAVYGYSFILTNLDISTPEHAADVEYWYRHRTEIENIFRDAKHGAALRHLPSGYPEVNTAWMGGSLLATSLAGYLHQLAATSPTPPPHPPPHPDPDPDSAPEPRPLVGLGVRDGKAMIATLRHRLIRVPGRLTHHAGQLILRLPPGDQLLPTVLARLRTLPYPPADPPRPPRPAHPEPATRGDTRAPSLPTTRKQPLEDQQTRLKITSRRYSRNRV